MTERRALVLSHDPDGGGCLVSERLRQRGLIVDEHLVCPDPTRPADANPFPAVDGYEILVPMGSVHSLADKAPLGRWIDEELALVRAAHDLGMSILGICFGGQLLADVLGGSVEVSPVTEIGWYEIEGEANPVGPGPWMEWHHDRFDPPPGAEVLARTESAVQLMRIGRSVGTQFHPEVDVAHVKSWLAFAEDDYLARYGVAREEILEEVRRHEDANRKQCFALVDWFLDEVAGSG